MEPKGCKFTVEALVGMPPFPTVSHFFVRCICPPYLSLPGFSAAGVPIYLWWGCPSCFFCEVPRDFACWLFLLGPKLVPIVPSLRNNTLLDLYMQGLSMGYLIYFSSYPLMQILQYWPF